MKTEIEIEKEKLKTPKGETGLQVTGNSPADMIRMAVSGGADLEKLEKLLAIQERWEANEARKAYHVAMSGFKAFPIKIERDRNVAYGTTKYSHASLANVVEKITEGLSKHGLSASWRTQQNGSISVSCKITHILGHSEETTLSAAADSSGSKNSIQAIGSTITYLERYTLLAALGLATHQDDDGSAAASQFITKEQKDEIFELMLAKDVNEEKFFEYMKISSLDEMKLSDFQKAVSAINSKKEKKNVNS